MSTRTVGAIAVVLAAALTLATACGGDNQASSSSSTAAPSSAGGTAGLVGSVTNTGISPDRCAANTAAGKITYLSGFDFAATASVVEVVVARRSKHGWRSRLRSRSRRRRCAIRRPTRRAPFPKRDPPTGTSTHLAPVANSTPAGIAPRWCWPLC